MKVSCFSLVGGIEVQLTSTKQTTTKTLLPQKTLILTMQRIFPQNSKQNRHEKGSESNLMKMTPR